MNSSPSGSARLRLWRQGDVLIGECAALPAGCSPLAGRIVARGEATGHSHRLQGARSAALFLPPPREMFSLPGLRYLEVTEGRCVLTHPEHGPVTLHPGIYRLWRQREFDLHRRTWRAAGD